MNYTTLKKFSSLHVRVKNYERDENGLPSNLNEIALKGKYRFYEDSYVSDVFHNPTWIDVFNAFNKMLNFTNKHNILKGIIQKGSKVYFISE